MARTCEWLQIPTVEEVARHYRAMGGFDYVVPGGGHGAAAVCRPLLERGYTVAGVANPIDEGGHSARIRWELYRRLGYWTIIPGDTMNLLGGGLAHPAIYAVTNNRLPKDTEGKSAAEVFGEAVDKVIAARPEEDRKALEDFREFVVELGDCTQRELVDTGIASLAGASFQNLLHAAVMVHVGAYRQGIDAVDQGRYLVGSYLLERAMHGFPNGTVLPMSFDKVTLVTQHAGGRTVVGGINRVLLAKGVKGNGLEYGDLVPNSMLTSAPEESEAEERAKLAAARVVDWHAAEVEHGPLSESFNNDWVFKELRPMVPRMNPRLVEVMRALKPGGMLVIPPGNAHESTYTFFLMQGVLEEIQAAKARGVRVVLVCNPVNLLLCAGYSVSDYLGCIEQALRHACGRRVAIEEVIDRVVVNDPLGASESAQRMMRGEGIPPEVKRELLHRTPTGPVTASPEEIRALQARGIEVVQRAMLEVQKISIRGIETDSVSYEQYRLMEALLD
jgi:2-phospho-L-lactate transferase/gluconeogenesis factor (CofD/UPF0052 family)